MAEKERISFKRLYHGTSKTAAEAIRKEGFKASQSGAMGKGVYASASKATADFYAQQAAQVKDFVNQQFLTLEELKKLGSRLQIRLSSKSPVNKSGSYYLLSEEQANKGLVKQQIIDAPKGFKPARLKGAKPTIGYQISQNSKTMPIKRGGQTRSNAGRYAPEGQGATQRGRNLPTPKGNERPMQTARLPRANMPGTVTTSGAARTAARGSAVGGALSRLSMVVPHLMAAYEGLQAGAAKAPGLTADMKQQYYNEAKGKRQMELRNQQLKADKGSFDDAFAAARQAGRQDFSWRGRKYNTKIKGEG